MPLLALLLLFLVASGGVAQAASDGEDEAPVSPSTLTLRTSLGPLSDPEGDGDADSRRELRARGLAPKGSRLVVRFYRAGKHLKTKRLKLRSSRRGYRTGYDIDRTGVYRIRVTASTPAGETVKVTAKLTYQPKANAPAAPNALSR